MPGFTGLRVFWDSVFSIFREGAFLLSFLLGDRLRTVTGSPCSGRVAQWLWTKKTKVGELTGEETSSTTTRIRAIHFQAANGTRAIGTQSMKTKIGANLTAQLFLVVSGNQAIVTGSGTLLDSTPCQ
jgi:hypothetical protein